MKLVVACMIGILCLSSMVFAQYPAIVASVTTQADSITYNYSLTNTTLDHISTFQLYMPWLAADAITSYYTSLDGAEILLRRTDRDRIGWYFSEELLIAPGNSVDFGFTTIAGIPTTNSFIHQQGSNTNWTWFPGNSNGTRGDTILPVPDVVVPEPSSIAGLAAGLLPIGLGVVRRRRKG